MEQNKKKAVTSLLMLLDSEGFEPFDQIPYRQLIRPLVWRDRLSGCSWQKIAIRYEISVSCARNIIKSLSQSDKES